ncbi:MAG: PilZ domain-containing protein [Acidobacteriota bacterium]|nr:PilZ domain-containing protein [Acidobacteriota bacterium]
MQTDTTNTAPAVKQKRERRNANRCRVEVDASLILLNQGAPLACSIEDLSLGGCRLRMNKKFLAGTLVRVEVNFQVCGVAQRFIGVTQWTDGDRVIGIRFVDMSERRIAALAELISDVQEQAALEAALAPEEEQEAETIFESNATESALPESKPGPRASEPPSLNDTNDSALPAAAPGDADSAALPATPRERRAHPRLNVDSGAVVRLIDLAADVRGRIIDLSLGGCLIQTIERFPVGIFRRVETEFRLHGLPFRLGGVTQTIYDPHRVGIRFLNMSDRKREQLSELIGEVMEHTSETEADSEEKGVPALEKSQAANSE